MEWIDVNNELPATGGKYIVKTKTMMGNQHRVDCLCTITTDKNGKDKISWGVTNQNVTHWLKEN